MGDVEKPLATYQRILSFRVFGLSMGKKESRRADSNRLSLLQLRVIIHALQGFAQCCKYRISKPVSFLSLAPCCTALRSQWYQSGIRIALPSACTDGGLKNRKYGLPRLCHLRKRVNIEEQARVPHN